MTLIIATSAPTKKRAPIKKKIFDWAELNAFLLNPPQAFDSDVGRHVAGMAARTFRTERWAQIGERLIAVAARDYISLVWAHNPPGTAIANCMWTTRVEVRPAAGSRTSYSMDTGCNGWFAAKHLPADRKDFGARSRYRHKIFMHGQSGVYQRGTGPLYHDVGPDVANVTLDQFCASLRDGTGPAVALYAAGATADWAGLAAALCQKIASAVAPFKDCIIRYEEFAPNGRPASLRLSRGEKHADLNPDYCVRIRVKLPATWSEGRCVEVPDFSAFICGPLGLMEKERAVYYGAELLHPQGRHIVGAAYENSNGSCSTGLTQLLYTGPSEVVEAARQWAANHIHIPC